MVEVLFYQLDRRPLEAVLPQLLERTLERGWRACVQAGSEERVEALSSALWTWREEAFLPHGTPRDGNGEMQPIWLTAGDDNPNGAAVRFLVDGAVTASLDGLERAVYLFDGHDPAALESARSRWSEAREAGHDVTYWQQDEDGRWVKRA
jgi:DNA polymerase-3 subunit chi